MRPRFQQGQIAHRGANWVLRYYEDRTENGAIKRVRTTATLAPYSAHPLRGSKADLEFLRDTYKDKIDSILAPVNNGAAPSAGSSGAIAVGEFIRHNYFNRLQWRLAVPAGNELHIEPSTVKGYKDVFQNHVEHSPAARVTVHNFTARDGQKFLESLPQGLSHKTHLRIKNFLRGVFTWAIADSVFHGVNPMEGTKAGGRTKKRTEGLTERERKIQESNSHAYTLEEVAEMLDKLPEPARTVCAVAAFTGLTRSELRGLKWSDYDGDTISVQRKVWNTHIGATKTEARETGVFVVPLLRQILAKYKKQFPQVGDGFIFRGEKFLKPLNLDNLSRNEIPQHINGAWFGWHAFRRGLGTRLNEAGVDDTEIQSILRHSDISTTQAYYILPNTKRAAAGLKRLSEVARRKFGIKA